MLTNILGDNKTLNIFTDASVLYNGDEFITSSGAIAVKDITTPNPTVIDRIFTINRNSTNNHGELSAILNGVELALKYRGYFSRINLFSDSKISIYGLRDWCNKWFNKIVTNEYGTIVSSSGTPVMNQELIKTIIRVIVDNRLEINLYHQKGHIDPTDSRSVNEALKIFNKSNIQGIHTIDSISYNDIAMISLFNGMVDSISRSYLKDLDMNRCNTVYPIKHGMNFDLFNQYKKLINMEGGRI